MKKLMLCALAITVSACGNSETIDFRGVDPGLTVAPTQILIMGTPHLSYYSEDIVKSDLTPLLERLTDFAPDIITVEDSSGMTCRRARTYPLEHVGYADGYCFDGAIYRKESNLTISEGSFQARKALLDWPDTPTPAQRRALAAAFIASEEPASAMVQWLQLNDADKIVGNGIGPLSIELFQKYDQSLNETYSIAVKLAAELGLQRVYYADDHGSFLSREGESDAYGARLTALWSKGEDACATQSETLSAKLREGHILEAYRDFNSLAYQRRKIECDWKLTMNDDEPEQYGREYTLGWQARNLRMTALIMDAAKDAPGGRIFSLVGAAHKPYFEAYLDQMHDVEIVSTDKVLY